MGNARARHHRNNKTARTTSHSWQGDEVGGQNGDNLHGHQPAHHSRPPMIAVLAHTAGDLSGVQILAFLGLAALAGAVAGDLVFGRHDRARARRAEADAARLRRHLMVLEGRSAVRRRRTRERAS